jgi:hypothetical protein
VKSGRASPSFAWAGRQCDDVRTLDMRNRANHTRLRLLREELALLRTLIDTLNRIRILRRKRMLTGARDSSDARMARFRSHVTPCSQATRPDPDAAGGREESGGKSNS